MRNTDLRAAYASQLAIKRWRGSLPGEEMQEFSYSNYYIYVPE